jgi:hypothetical protein
MEIFLPKTLYKVTMTEYERGFGQRHMGERFFEHEYEAKEFCRNYASGDEDCFFRASYTKVK